MWDWAVWGALVVAICGGIAGVALVAVRVVEAVRTFGIVRRRAEKTLAELAAKAEVMAAKAESASDTRELEETVARLRGSLAQLRVLRAALAQVEKQFGWVRVLL